jgi:hypothetical protein
MFLMFTDSSVDNVSVYDRRADWHSAGANV